MAVKIKSSPSGKLQDGGGLILDKAEATGKWLFRCSFAATKRAMILEDIARHICD